MNVDGPRIAALTGIYLVLMLPATAFQTSRRAQSRRNRPPVIESFKASGSVVDLCPWAPGGSCHSGSSVTLHVNASDPDNDDLVYQYSVTKGAIKGSGSTVDWDLTYAFGTQTVKVAVSDGRGRNTTATTQVEVIECKTCDPPCTILSVGCPMSVLDGKTVEFVATVSGDNAPGRLIYLWSHSNGKRIEQESDAKLRVKALGFPGDTITATVTVLGLDPACNRQASCKTTIARTRGQ